MSVRLSVRQSRTTQNWKTYRKTEIGANIPLENSDKSSQCENNFQFKKKSSGAKNVKKL